MSSFHYKHIQHWEKQKLERLIADQPTLKPIYGMTSQGWGIISYKYLVDINLLAFKLGRERKTIKNELIRGKYQTLTNSITNPTHTFSYSKDASDQHSKVIYEKKSVQQTKILINQKLREYILNLLPMQSLKGIAGRIKKEYHEGSVDFCISHTSLYGYIENKRVGWIDESSLKRRRKQRYRMIYKGKRQNGTSIDERPERINDRSEFGHWEIDLIEGKRGTKTNLLTLSERKTKKGIAMKINGKETKTINKALRMLQTKDILIYGNNVKSITTDNGSEFWAWKTFAKSIHNSRDDIEVFFCNPYHSWEKGGVENFNKQIRRKFPKGTDFTNISNTELEEAIDWINNLFRESLGYATSTESYNGYVQN